jgi:hypothetical protein
VKYLAGVRRKAQFKLSLKDCKKFWELGIRNGNLERAIDQIRQGIKPDFESRFAEYGCDGGKDCDHT